jgi:hypothetical protein
MKGRIEAPRRHGHFDPRWLTRRRVTADWRAAAEMGLKAVPDGLEWGAFSTRYFPGRRRHDLEAISAYDSRSIGPNEPALTVVGGARRAGEQP